MSSVTREVVVAEKPLTSDSLVILIGCREELGLDPRIFIQIGKESRIRGSAKEVTLMVA